jgi:hypothetical protein
VLGHGRGDGDGDENGDEDWDADGWLRVRGMKMWSRMGWARDFSASDVPLLPVYPSKLHQIPCSFQPHVKRYPHVAVSQVPDTLPLPCLREATRSPL